jgi:T5SS/PEP-CTERM-associated repeat protein
MIERTFLYGAGRWQPVLAAVLALLPATAAQATKFWRNGVTTGNWSTPTNWSSNSASDTTTSGVPGAEAVNIVNTDGTARTVTLDVSTPTLGLISIDLTGAGTAADTLSIPITSNVSLTSNALFVGGYSGSAATAGRGAVIQSAGAVAMTMGSDLALAYGGPGTTPSTAASTGTYTLNGGTFTAPQSEFIGYGGAGTFNQNGGTNTIGVGSIGAFYLAGLANSSGTYNLNAGQLLSSKSEKIGEAGTGLFTQTGGINTISGTNNLDIGDTATATGTYTASGSAMLNVGGNANVGVSGAGTLNVQTGASVNITGALNIGAGDNVNLSGGTLRFNGYSRNATGVFTYTGGTVRLAGNRVVNSDATIVDIFGALPAITTGRTLAIEGQVDVNANMSVNGGTLQGLSNSLTFRIGENAAPAAQLSVSNGGHVTAAGDATFGGVATSGAGGLSVSGAGSSFAAVGALTIGPHGNGSMQVLNGGAVTSDSSLLGSVFNTSGNVLLSGTGSSWTIANSLTVGGTGFGILAIGAGTTVSVGTSLSINSDASTVVNLNGGTLRFNTLSDPSNKLNFNSGTLQLAGNRSFGPGLDPVIDHFFGASPTIVTGKNLTVEGVASIQPSSPLTLSGGTLTVGSLVDNGTFNFDSGTLNITQPNVSTVITGTLNMNLAGTGITTPITTTDTSTININANNISLGNFASFIGFNNHGVLNVGANTISILSEGYAQLGSLTTINGGTIFAVNGMYLSGGGNLVGSGTLSSRFTGASGSVVEATGTLAIGDSTSAAGFNFDGELHTKQFTVTLNSSAPAGLGNLTTLGTVSSPGTLTATNGFVVDFDEAITGFGTISSLNTLAKHATINGTVQGASAGQPITFTGYIKGTGTFTNVTFAGTFSPGLSPTLTSAGNLAMASSNTLEMELGGTTAGSSYDEIQATGALALGGTLHVSLINGFVPVAGQSFDILDWGTLMGTFSSISLPTLSGLTWNTSQLYTNGVISVASASLPGDFNHDGVVGAADYVAWRKGLGTVYTPTDYNVWRANFGAPSGSGVGASLSGSAVPEPGGIVLLFLAAIGSSAPWRRRAAG